MSSDMQWLCLVTVANPSPAKGLNSSRACPFRHRSSTTPPPSDSRHVPPTRIHIVVNFLVSTASATPNKRPICWLTWVARAYYFFSLHIYSNDMQSRRSGWSLNRFVDLLSRTRNTDDGHRQQIDNQHIFNRFHSKIIWFNPIIKRIEESSDGKLWYVYKNQKFQKSLKLLLTLNTAIKVDTFKFSLMRFKSFP